MKKTRLKGYFYDFNVDYNAFAVADILDIQIFVYLFIWIFVSAMMFFGCNLSSVNLLECVSMNNQECKVRPEIVNVNSDEPVFFPLSISASKCSDSCNNINDLYSLMLLKI